MTRKYDPAETGRFRLSDIERALEEDHQSRALEGCVVWTFLIGFVVAVAILLLGCRPEDDDYDRATPTPAGYRVRYEDQGTIASGLMTGQQILEAFDAAMIRASKDLAARYGVDAGAVLSIPHHSKVVFRLVDHAWFTSGGGGRAVGEWLGDTIIVAIHAHRSIPQGSALPADALPWTPLNVSGVIHYGVLDLTGFAPALAHELGHLIWGGGFEH